MNGSRDNDDWYVNKSTGEVIHSPKNGKGYEVTLGDDWEHFAEESEIKADYDAISCSEGDCSVFYNSQEAQSLMNKNGMKLAPREILRDLHVRYLVNQVTPSGVVTVKQTNETQIWFNLTYVKMSSVLETKSTTSLFDETLLNGYHTISTLSVNYSKETWYGGIFRYGKEIHKKGSVESAGSSFIFYIGFNNYPANGILNNYKNNIKK